MASTKALILAALASHNASTLLDIIKGDPNWDTINHLVNGFIDVAQSDPTDVANIANTILTVRNASDAPAINCTEPSGQPTQRKLSTLLSREIYEILTWAFSCETPSSITPENPFLLAAMISGACARIKLCNSSAQAFEITCGLQINETDYKNYFTPDKYELHALHACLQLLVGGSAGLSTDQMGYEKDKVLPALKSIEKKDIIKSVNGKRLLQVRSLFFLIY